MSDRVLKHFRFGSTFAKINRTLRSRRKAISKIMTLYKKYDLVSDGCSLCESNNFTYYFTPTTQGAVNPSKG